MTTEAFVLPTLTNLIPAFRVSGTRWKHIEGLPLADPAFDTPAGVDLILGADSYHQTLEPAICRGPPGTPTAQLTTLGWVLIGPTSGDEPAEAAAIQVSLFHAQTQDELSEQLQKFWELEEVGRYRIPTPDEAWAEAHFLDTHSRDHTDRYVVRASPTAGSRSDSRGFSSSGS